MKKYYVYRVMSENGVLSYVGRNGRNIVSTPVTFTHVGAAIKVAKTLRLKTGKLHDVVPVRTTASTPEAKAKARVESIPSVGKVGLAKFKTPPRDYK